ncbi:MAG: hypothetical protein ABJZ55_18770 [Fuerstiella sp.]
MSKKFRQFQTASVGFLVLLQLVLLPASEVLHLGCQHSHDEPAADFSTIFDVIETAWNACARTSCCNHDARCVDAHCVDAHSVDGQPSDPDPVRLPHDESSCAVCQAIFADRIPTTSPGILPTVESVCEVTVFDSHSACSAHCYCRFSRGPPAAVQG